MQLEKEKEAMVFQNKEKHRARYCHLCKAFGMDKIFKKSVISEI